MAELIAQHVPLIRVLVHHKLSLKFDLRPVDDDSLLLLMFFSAIRPRDTTH
jgi:hypothetical protein